MEEVEIEYHLTGHFRLFLNNLNLLRFKFHRVSTAHFLSFLKFYAPVEQDLPVHDALVGLTSSFHKPQKLQELVELDVLMTFEFEFHSHRKTRTLCTLSRTSSGHAQFGCLRCAKTLDRILMG